MLGEVVVKHVMKEPTQKLEAKQLKKRMEEHVQGWHLKQNRAFPPIVQVIIS